MDCMPLLIRPRNLFNRQDTIMSMYVRGSREECRIHVNIVVILKIFDFPMLPSKTKIQTQNNASSFWD